MLVDQRTVQLSQAALNNYEVLQTGFLPIGQDGYVSVYVGNESAVDVLFDDMQVEYRQGLLVQENQYDPAGLELAGLAPPSPGIRGLNNYRFNGKEFQADLGLAWNHQDWRFFDSQLLRWHTGDPELENGQESWTPYSFGYDNAVRYADADGRAPGQGDDNPNYGRAIRGGVLDFVMSSLAGSAPLSAINLWGIGNALVNHQYANAAMQTASALNPGVGLINMGAQFIQGDKETKARIGTQVVLTAATVAVTERLATRVAAPKIVLPRAERLAKFKNALQEAPAVSSPKAVIKLVNKTLNKVEKAHAGPEDRMYGVLDNKYVTYNPDGTVTAKTKGHQINMESNGGFTITDRINGSTFVDKSKK